MKFEKYREQSSQTNRTNMTIGMKIWLAFMLFTAIVFVLMWLLQIVFLQTFYPVYKINQTKKIASEISAIYSTSATLSEDIQQIAFKNNACIEVLDSQGREKIGVDVLNGNCMLHGNRVDSYIIFDKLTASDSGTFTMKTYDNKIQSDVILYGCVIGSVDSPEGYILLDLPLAPVESFISIIKSQTLYIISILLVIALIISIYISNHIANPLKRITKSAQQLAKGDYTAKFEGGGYYEADKLAETLTFAESEISKVEMMQRDLIANTSHDLKTPLTMLKAYAEMIRDLSGDNPDKRNKHLKIIIDETDRLTALVNDMLDLSKIESGSQKLDITQFDISAKMDTIFSRYSLLSKQSDYHIYFESAQSCIVECDEGKIERVICNLINNAINYTSKEKNIYLREIIQPDGVIIEVEDTGDGIEKDKIKLIFDKYYRSENHKRETMGTGLGLSIVKAILQMHDYGFGVRSQVGKGSVFWFKIKR